MKFDSDDQFQIPCFKLILNAQRKLQSSKFKRYIFLDLIQTIYLYVPYLGIEELKYTRHELTDSVNSDITSVLTEKYKDID